MKKKQVVEAIYPLSPMQQGMLFHTLYAPDSGVSFYQLCATLQGALDIPAFQRAWQQIVDRHPALRTAFNWKRRDEPFQVVYQRVKLPWLLDDWRALDRAAQDTRLAEYLATDRTRGFELSQPPLMRFALFQLADDAYQFVWSHHHLLIDGWSVPPVVNEVLLAYAALRQGQEATFEQRRPYRDYIAWLQQQDLAQAEAFWRRTLRGFHTPIFLGVDSLIGPASTAPEHYGDQHAGLSTEHSAGLQALARQHGLTLNTLVQGAWALLLGRYSGAADVVFGATVAGRPPDLPGVERMIGLFINTLPVRVVLPPTAALRDWLTQLQAQQVEARQYEYSPLVQVQTWSDVPRGQPLFESIVLFENYPVGTTIRGRMSDLAISDVRAVEQANYPITVVAVPGAELIVLLSYDERRFDAATISRMLRHMQTLLVGMLVDPARRLSELPLLTRAERWQLLGEWNDTRRADPDAHELHDLVAAQAARAPDAVALVAAEQHLTYQALDARANQLAHYLQQFGVGPELLVALCLERSLDMVLALLAVRKAGGAYLPLDPAAPSARLAHILEASAAPLLLTSSVLLDRLPTTWALVLDLEADAAQFADAPTTPPPAPTTPDQLAYALFTSGSTGAPKGVLLAQRGLSNLLHAQSRLLPVTSASRVLQFAALSFDAALSEIGTALTMGATLVLAPPTLLTGGALHALLHAQRISVVTLPPAALALLPPDPLPALRTLLVAGEACPPALVARWAPGRRLVNGYGPTETTIGAVMGAGTAANGALPLGRTLANMQVYLLDDALQPVPIGVVGELFIGGVQLARGYLNRADLTAERFVPNPFVEVSGAGYQVSGAEPSDTRYPTPDTRLYKTGDRARYQPDGQLVFMGRRDGQVKLRGFRIELGEVEAVLGQHPAVRACAVLARDEQAQSPTNAYPDKRLVAYVVTTNDEGRTTKEIVPVETQYIASVRRPSSFVQELRDYLQQRLPDYMLPAAFVLLESLPLNAHGKIDRAALPAPDAAHPARGGAHTPPRTPVEEVIAGIWSEVLGVAEVGTHDNFLDLGGHSLLATQVIARVQEIFQVDLPIRSLFESPTVAGLAEQVMAFGRDAAQLLPLQPTARQADLPLSFAQQRLWFLDQLAPNSPVYNIPAVVRLSGSLDIAALHKCLNQIVARHEALRTRFPNVAGQPVQLISSADEAAQAIPLLDLQALIAEREAVALRLAEVEALRPFDLARGPLLRAALLRLQPDQHILLLTLHHIVSDGWSLGVLIREIAALYADAAAHRPSTLPELPIQYADYAVWQRNWLQGPELAAQLAYWKQRLADLPTLDLPTDFARPARASYQGDSYAFALPATLRADVLALSKREGVTMFMALLAAFQGLLARYSGQEDLAVGAPIANRAHAATEPLIGFFVNTVVLRADLSGMPSGRALLLRARESCLGSYAHQDVPFEQVVELLAPTRDLGRHPLFQVLFALQNAPLPPLALPKLTLQALPLPTTTTRFDLTLTLADDRAGLFGRLEYRTDLYTEATIQRMASHFETLLQGLVAQPDQPFATLPLLSSAERSQIVVAWNATATSYPPANDLHALIAEQAARSPDAIAVVRDDAQLSYQHLLERAHQLAHLLQQHGVGPDVGVAIALDRSLELLVGLLATLAAGGTYVPLDIDYPPQRLAFMLADSQAKVLLVATNLQDKETSRHGDKEIIKLLVSVSPCLGQVVDLTIDWPRIAQECAANPAPAAIVNRKSKIVNADNLAYLIYTSGSTGTPKGAMVSHRSIINRLRWMQQTYQLNAADRVLHKTPISFDVSVWELIWPLLHGVPLVLAPPGVPHDPVALAQLLARQQITLLHFVPSLLELFLSTPTLPRLRQLRQLICSGEALAPDLAARAVARLDAALDNLYGPTEAAIDVSAWRYERADAPARVLIGRPIANTQLYVLDQQLRPVPIGVAGELFIGGVQLARGYLGRPDLTAERFVPNPFAITNDVETQYLASLSPVQTQDLASLPPVQTQYLASLPHYHSSRLYRTGDLARYHADGQLEYLGRRDGQVKLRGVRIELDEIAAALRAHPDVAECAVRLWHEPASDPRLVAYVVRGSGVETARRAGSTTDPRPQIGERRAVLSKRLPAAMIPGLFVPLDALPLTPNGKLDRRALPAPDPADRDPGATFVAPHTPDEALLAGIWAEILNIARIGRDDNFFALGGHSLLATRVLSRIRETFQIELPLHTLFEAPTVAELARAIAAHQAAYQPTAVLEPIAREPEERLLASLDQLSEAELDALLSVMSTESEPL